MLVIIDAKFASRTITTHMLQRNLFLRKTIFKGIQESLLESSAFSDRIKMLPQFIEFWNFF